MTNRLFAITDNAQLYFRILGPLQTVHRLFVGHILANKWLIVDLDNLVASNQTSTLSGSIANHILHTDGIIADGKLNAHTRERTLQIVVGNLHILGANIDRMGVKF